MNTRGKSEPTDEEIRQVMDFDGLLKAYQASQATTLNKPSAKWAKTAIGFAVILATIYGVYTWQKSVSAKSDQLEIEQNTPPVEIEKPVESTPQIVQLDSSFKTTSKESKAPAKPTVSNKPIPEEEVSSVQPQYIGAEPVEGFPALYAYFDRELKYPLQALSDSIQGVETVAFLIDKSGKPVKIEIQQSLGEVFDWEVIRLLQNMPPWKPATLNGEPVMSKQSVPFTFKITRKTETKK
jgi:TonB family protein